MKDDEIKGWEQAYSYLVAYADAVWEAAQVLYKQGEAHRAAPLRHELMRLRHATALLRKEFIRSAGIAPWRSWDGIPDISEAMALTKLCQHPQGSKLVCNAHIDWYAEELSREMAERQHFCELSGESR